MAVRHGRSVSTQPDTIPITWNGVYVYMQQCHWISCSIVFRIAEVWCRVSHNKLVCKHSMMKCVGLDLMCTETPRLETMPIEGCGSKLECLYLNPLLNWVKWSMMLEVCLLYGNTEVDSDYCMGYWHVQLILARSTGPYSIYRTLRLTHWLADKLNKKPCLCRT